MDVSCAFATSLDTPAHIELAESLGYRRAWCYDSPALYPDVWMVLGLAAARTSTIQLGPGVLVPSLRHPMANAAAIASLEALAPGRAVVAVGAGFTGRMAMGQRAMRWADVATYVRALRGLLRGEDVEWDGATIRMLHPDGYGAARPIDVPILIGADGPKGLAVAAELGDGVFSAGLPQQGDGPAWRALLAFGTVLDDGEDVSSPRVQAAAGHAIAVAYHAMYERGGPTAVDGLPGGAGWRASIESVPEAERHLAIHDGHLIAPNQHDDAAWPASSAMVTAIGLSGTAAEVAAKVDGMAAAGVTEIAYQPAGDIPTELRRMAAALGLG